MVMGRRADVETASGPPAALAVARDYSFVLAACPQKIGEGGKNVSEKLVSVIGLDDVTKPKLLQQVEAGEGTTAVYLNKAGTVALATGVGDDTITLFTIKDRKLTRASQGKLEAKAEPREILIAEDGKTAYALRFGDGKVTKLAITGDQLSRVTDWDVGVQPDGGALTRDGRWLIVNNFGGAPGTPKGNGATTVTDTRTGKITYAVEVGALPEVVALSPDNKYVALVIGNGSATVRNAPNYDSVFGKLSLFAVGQGKAQGTLIHITDAQLGHACQGAVWSDDGKRLLVQCSVERDIRVFDFDGKALTERPEAVLKMVSRPGAMVTNKTR